MWMSKSGRAFVGLIALATMMSTVAPMSAGAKPPKEGPPVFITMSIEDEAGHTVLRTAEGCGGPLAMVQSTKRLRVDWTESDLPGVPGLHFDGWGLTGCHGATDYVPEGMAGGFLILDETPRGLELISRFDYEWIDCTTGKGRTGCSNVRVYELSGLFPGLDLTLTSGPQNVDGTLSLSKFVRDEGWTEMYADIDVAATFDLTTP